MGAFLYTWIRFWVLAGCPVCLPPNELVIADSGPVQISKIKVGDRVLTHRGRFMPVTDVGSRIFDGDLVEIKTKYFSEPSLITSDHPIRAIKTEFCPYNSPIKKRCYIEKSGSHTCRYCKFELYRNHTVDFVPAGVLKKGDLVSLPILGEILDCNELQLSTMLAPFSESNGQGFIFKKNKYHKGVLIPEAIPVNEDFMSLSGFYLSEGWSGFHGRDGTTQFSFSAEEQDYAFQVQGLLRNLFKIESRLFRKDNVLVVEAYSWLVAKLFSSLFSSRSEDKKMPLWFLLLPLEKQKYLLETLWKGDGYKPKHAFVFSTSSCTLAYQVRLILNRLGLMPTTHITKTNGGNIIKGRRIEGKHWQYLLSCQGKGLSYLSHVLHWNHGWEKERSKTWELYWVKDGHIFFPIDYVKRVHYHGLVHNLEVAVDNTYTLSNMTVHNCRKLLGYDEGDQDLKSIFKAEGKVQRILQKQGFKLDEPHFTSGRVWFDRLRRGSQLRRDLALRRSQPDLYIDLETTRLIKIVEEYGVEYVRHAIFIDRVEMLNVSHPVNTSLMYKHQIRVVPTVMAPYAPFGILRGLSAEEPEIEIERMLFLGGSKIRPAQDVTRLG
jgi:hypothetical protein